MKHFTLAFLVLTSCHGAGGGSDTGAAGGGGPAGSGTGAHYWIDPAGNDGWPGTDVAPWRTVERIESVSLQPGDIVHVRPGFYDIGSLFLTGVIGSSTAWISIQAEGSVTIRGSGGNNVINIENCRYLLIRGFEITYDNGGAPYGSWDGVDGIKFQNAPSDNVTIQDCRIHDLGNVGIGSQAPEVSFLQVLQCEIYNCYTGLYWGYYEDPSKRYAHYGRIAGNYFHDCPPVDLDGTGYGMQIKGGSRGNVIEDNVFVNVGGDTRAAIAVYHASTNLATTTDRNVIRRNFIRGSRNEGIYAAEGATIENNIVYDCATLGISLSPRNTGGWGVFYGEITVRHNTVFQGPTGLYVSGAAGASTILLSSNLLLVGGGQALQGPAGFPGSASQNLCWGATSGSNLGVVAVTSSAVLSTTYGSANFLRPAAANPAGANAGAAVDFDNVARATPPSAGAYESGSTGWVLADGFKT